jgi:hypothetical protein
MGQGKKGRNKVTSRNEEAEQTNYRKGRKLVGTSLEDAIRKSSQATFIL